MTSEKIREVSLEHAVKMRDARHLRLADMNIEDTLEKLKMLTEESKVAALYEIAAQLAELNEYNQSRKPLYEYKSPNLKTPDKQD